MRKRLWIRLHVNYDDDVILIIVAMDTEKSLLNLFQPLRNDFRLTSRGMHAVLSPALLKKRTRAKRK